MHYTHEGSNLSEEFKTVIGSSQSIGNWNYLIFFIVVLWYMNFLKTFKHLFHFQVSNIISFFFGFF